ncbi:acyltransferase [Flavobacterium sp.]|uniref:acyltransferase family protein n=1 Tax=Flavobacterium sp. TaxID=239 RepID=UPI0025E68A6F|nr:acyltransferase [Flavobacterium sp.]
MATTNRLREIDFLRGIAIILVLLRHKYLFQFTTTMGWIGVDLFFTLSGFLVSGLLFKEFLKFGDIQPKRFLIRRGFKIYPIYYLFYILYLIPILLYSKFKIVPFLSDMVFMQNYVCGWGYAYGASWSLAIEEHFYFGLAIFLWLGIKYNFIILKADTKAGKKAISFQKLIISILILCLLLRLISNTIFPAQLTRNFTMTHLRIDSLIAGVYVSYLFYFKRQQLTEIFARYKYVFISIAFLGLVWTPFIEPLPSFFVKTIGFTFLYISFGITLIYFILNTGINKRLDSLFSAPIVNVVSKIGYCSYSIYIIHSLINDYTKKMYVAYNLPYNNYFDFFATSAISISLGMLMTYIIEDYFLRIRNNYVPTRI